MNANECARLAAAINLLRPEWPAESLRTFIARNLGNRPYLDAAVALTYVACDPDSTTPGRVMQDGPWWFVGKYDEPPRPKPPCNQCREWHPGEDRCPPPPARDVAGYAAAARANIRPMWRPKPTEESA